MIEDLQAEFGIPRRITIAPGENGLPKITLTHQSGARAEIYLHGGHVTSWTNARGDELFFLSREALFAPGKPIRGGIPVCFPQFSGQGPLPQHGFARTSEWGLAKTELLDNGIVAAELQLVENVETLALWPHRFVLTLGMLLDENALTVAVQVRNTSAQPFDFQLALHTYFAVGNIRQAAVRGLKGTILIDALRDGVRETETWDTIRFDQEIDRIYANAPDCLRLDDEENGRTVTIRKANMPDVVVWNPWVAKSQRMADFGDDEYLRMVCIETGRIVSPCKLPPGDQWQGETRFSH